MIRFMNTASSLAILFVDQSGSQQFSYNNGKGRKNFDCKVSADGLTARWLKDRNVPAFRFLSTAKHLAYFSLYTWDVYRIWIRIEQILNFRVQYLILWFALLVIQKEYSHKKMLLTEVLPPGGNKKWSFSFYLAV